MTKNNAEMRRCRIARANSLTSLLAGQVQVSNLLSDVGLALPCLILAGQKRGD